MEKNKQDKYTTDGQLSHRTFSVGQWCYYEMTMSRCLGRTLNHLACGERPNIPGSFLEIEGLGISLYEVDCDHRVFR